jgi:large subunit ribosomal protein L25
MSQALSIDAEPREEFGKNAARRLRRNGRVPAIVYGDQGPAIPVAVEPRKILSILQSESGHNAIFTLEIKGKAPARVMLRDWTVDPVHGGLLHVDIVRVGRDTKLKIKVPIHITGEAQGVKVQGGILEFMLREVELECLPDDIPENITVDVTELTIGKNLRVSDLKLGDKVKVLTDPARVVAHVVVIKEEEAKPAGEIAEATPAEPEIIRKGKAEVEGAEAEAEADEGKEGKEGKKEKQGNREAKKESKKE